MAYSFIWGYRGMPSGDSTHVNYLANNLAHPDDGRSSFAKATIDVLLDVLPSKSATACYVGPALSRGALAWLVCGLRS